MPDQSRITRDPSAWEHFKGLIFHAFPHHIVSRGTYWLTRRKSWIKNPLISLFVWFFNIDMRDAIETNPLAYASFNEFFIRSLKPGTRPLTSGEQFISSPADGRVSQSGPIESGRIFQAKGQSFTVDELLGGHADLADHFRNGSFLTVYLSPRDYHRVHLPMDGILETMLHVPGRLFSVAPYAVAVIQRLFARNERMAAIFNSSAGRFAVVMVGAVNVAAIETVWAGLVTPPHGSKIRRFDYGKNQYVYRRGDEMGRFNMGSTAIVLFEDGMANLDPALEPEMRLLMGQTVGQRIAPGK